MRLCQRTKTDSLWFASSAARAERASACASGCPVVAVDPVVEGEVVELAWFDPLEQPASATLETTRANVPARVIWVPRSRPRQAPLRRRGRCRASRAGD